MVLVQGGDGKGLERRPAVNGGVSGKVAGNKGMRLGRYELGRTLGEGNFGKVKYARQVDSGQSFAVKILEKNRILDLRITDQVRVFDTDTVMCCSRFVRNSCLIEMKL